MPLSRHANRRLSWVRWIRPIFTAAPSLPLPLVRIAPCLARRAQCPKHAQRRRVSLNAAGWFRAGAC